MYFLLINPLCFPKMPRYLRIMGKSTITEMIQILLTPVCELSESQMVLFKTNRSDFRAAGKTEEYHKALCEDMRKKSETAGATATPHLNDHVTHKSGRRKTVCTSAALAFFNIHPSRYHYSGHAEQDNAVLRKFGWSVRSRKSKFKVKGGKMPSLAQVRKRIEKDDETGNYKVSIRLAGGDYHCIVLDDKAEIVVDTASSKTTNRSKVRDIFLVRRK